METPRWVICVTTRSRFSGEGTPRNALEEPGWSRRIITVITTRCDPGDRAWYLPINAFNDKCLLLTLNDHYPILHRGISGKTNSRKSRFSAISPENQHDYKTASTRVKHRTYTLDGAPQKQRDAGSLYYTSTRARL